MSISINRVRGTEDALNMTVLNRVVSKIASILHQHGFDEMRTPALEKTELFVRAVGTDTDIVSKEMYTFESQSEGGICLRPELTAPMVRAFYEHGIDRAPWKVFQFGPAFRHERPQKGRLRQFFTFSIEVMNAQSVGYDVATLVMFDRMFKELGIKDFVLNLNFLGVVADRQNHRGALKDFLCSNDAVLCETCRTRREKNVLRVFDCKNGNCQQLYQSAPQLESFLCEASKVEWTRIKTDLQLMGVNFILNPLLVRGLDYYNGVVFEFTSDALGAQSTFCGGGRYDLSESLGKKEALPSVGAGIGFERICMILEAQNNPLVTAPVVARCVAIVPMEAAQEQAALLLADDLWRAGITADIVFDGASMKHKMKRADKMNAPFVCVLGEREVSTGVANIKNMTTGQASEVVLRDVAVFLANAFDTK